MTRDEFWGEVRSLCHQPNGVERAMAFVIKAFLDGFLPSEEVAAAKRYVEASSKRGGRPSVTIDGLLLATRLVDQRGAQVRSARMLQEELSESILESLARTSPNDVMRDLTEDLRPLHASVMVIFAFGERTTHMEIEARELLVKRQNQLPGASNVSGHGAFYASRPLRSTAYRPQIFGSPPWMEGVHPPHLQVPVVRQVPPDVVALGSFSLKDVEDV
jgi:hypothetical protein